VKAKRKKCRKKFIGKGDHIRSGGKARLISMRRYVPQAKDIYSRESMSEELSDLGGACVMENISAKTAGGLRQYWKTVLWIIGVPSILDIIKEWARGRMMDWLVVHLGPFGSWFAENPVAFFTLGLFSAGIFLAISVLRNEFNPPASVIVDVNRRPYVSPPRLKETVITVVCIVGCLGLAGFGTWKYFAIKNTPIVAVATVANQQDHTSQTPPTANDGAHPAQGTSPSNPSTVKNETSRKQQPSLSSSSATPSQSQPAPPPIPTSAPTSIIPADPEKAVEAVNAMRNSLAEVLGKKDTITFLMSWPDDDSSNLAFISGILSSACRTQPRQCWFAQRSNPNNLDYPTIPEPTRAGLTVHGADADSIAVILGRWFSTYSSSSIPKNLSAYKQPETKELIWIEIGPGSPWKSH
jgi:hypothetical protein